MKLFLSILMGVLILALPSCRYANDASDTAFKEFKPSALLEKYESFKDMSAVLDKKLADIKVYESRFQTFKEDYGNLPRSEWTREDREQYNIWLSESDGIKMSYNDLSAEYNAAMSKFNYRFCNVGELPKGASTPLPREYKPYLEK